jgi:hypothetical protein
MLRDELDERVTAIRGLSNEKKRVEIAAHQIDFFMRRMVQVRACPAPPSVVPCALPVHVRMCIGRAGGHNRAAAPHRVC